MKKLLLVIVGLIVALSYAASQPEISAQKSEVNPKTWEIESFCGYKFGSEYSPNQCNLTSQWFSTMTYFVSQKKLERPFRHFTDVELRYGSENKKLYRIKISFAATNGWSESMIQGEVENLGKILSEKYAVLLEKETEEVGWIKRTTGFKMNAVEDEDGYTHIGNTYISVACSRDLMNDKHAYFFIIVERSDIRREDIKMQDNKVKDETMQKIENGMNGGGAEVL